MINLIRNRNTVAGRRNAALWLVDLPEREQICCAPSCEFYEKRATKPKFVAQSRPALYFSQRLSSTRNECFCCATSWLRTMENGKHRPKLAKKQCCATSWGFLCLVFRRLKEARNIFHFPQTSLTNSFPNTVWFIVSQTSMKRHKFSTSYFCQKPVTIATI